MKKTIITISIAISVLLSLTACSEGENLNTGSGGNDSGNAITTKNESGNDNSNVDVNDDYAPFLFISYDSEKITAMQGTTSWSGENYGYEADSNHPLQNPLSLYNDVTIHLNGSDNVLEITFNQDYSPVTMTAVRWLAEYASGSQDIGDVLDKGEAVNVTGNKILVNDDGNDYIYEIAVHWEERNSRSRYAFRTVSNSDNSSESGNVLYGNWHEDEYFNTVIVLAIDSEKVTLIYKDDEIEREWLINTGENCMVIPQAAVDVLVIGETYDYQSQHGFAYDGITAIRKS